MYAMPRLLAIACGWWIGRFDLDSVNFFGCSYCLLLLCQPLSRCDVGHDAMSHIWPDGGDCVGILMVIDCLRARLRRRQQCRLSDDAVGSCTR